MADDELPVRKKKTLPPLSTKGDGESADNPKTVKRKVKKKTPRTEENEVPLEGDSTEVKPTPKRRRNRSQSHTRESAAEKESEQAPIGDTETTAAPKKKKKRKPKTEGENEGVDQEDKESARKQESQGSKTSLITTEGETPRKKGGKKKKKVKKAVVEEDEYGDSPWADDLRTMAEDIIAAGSKKFDDEEEGDEGGDGETVQKKDLQTNSVFVPSRPLDKIFIETSSKFKGLDRGIYTKQMAEEGFKATTVAPTSVLTRQTTIDFALASHRLLRVITLFLHGLTAGLCLWQMVTIFTLTSFSKADFLEHYYETSMPLQSCLYFLLVVNTVSVCDRFDIGNPTPRFILRSLTLQNGAVSIVLYVVALAISLVALRYEDKIYLYKEQAAATPTTVPGTTANPADVVSDTDVEMFRSLNTARCVFAIVGWIVLSITPNCDRLGKNLQSGETGLEADLKMDKISQA